MTQDTNSQARISPTAPSKLPPKKLYGALALAEMVTWALLILGMVLKYSGITEALVPVFGLVHGVVFLAYCVVTVFVWVNQRWGFVRGLLGLASAIVPFATLPFERATARRGLLEGGWRLAPGGERPSGAVEQLQALCLRRPVAASVAGAVLIAAATAALLAVGPPVPKG